MFQFLKIGVTPRISPSNSSGIVTYPSKHPTGELVLQGGKNENKFIKFYFGLSIWDFYYVS